MQRMWKYSGLLIVLLTVLSGTAAGAGEVPTWLPHYDMDIRFDLDQHQALVHERVTWINRHGRAAQELVFNAHSHYKIPDADIGFLAKSVEILRMSPRESMDFEGHACDVRKITLLGMVGLPSGDSSAPPPPGQPTDGEPALTLPAPRILSSAPTELPFHYREDNLTALVVPLPRPVAQGESVTIDLEFVMHLPQTQGRWGQWRGVTYLSNWSPVLAYYDEGGWQPTPFIPWHQPFFNEAGVYDVHVTLPCDQTVACTGSVVATQELGNGLKQIEIRCCAARDFAFLCSARYQEFSGQAGPVRVHCLAFPEHEHFAREFVRIACEAITTYSRWFGPYPYPEFTIAESYFGWNGNECAGLVMIDERVFGMPHMATGYVEYLVSHETCHQWWYNTVGTNGYCETWMDEALATYFSHRLLTGKYGKNNVLLAYPKGLEWLPNIHREDYRYYGLYGTLARGEAGPTVQPMEKFGHIINLFSMTYDRGNKIVGIIEDRLGEAAFFDFMRIVYARYQFRVIRVADFQRELEEYTHQSWADFFHHWLYSADMTDWCVEKVQISPSPLGDLLDCLPFHRTDGPKTAGHGPYQVTVLLQQKAEYNEQTVLGFCLDGSDNYQVRVPILPQAGHMELEDPPTKIDMLPENRVRVEIVLPCKPTQIAVDPDQILVDRDPANNYWKPRVRWRFTPLYTQLEETDLTNAYDRWNFTAGPWLYGASYDDPWFTRTSRIGARASLYRTQEFDGGAYLAYRSDERDLVAGADAVWNHWPWPHTEVGINVESGLTENYWGKETQQGVVFGRYVFQYSSSLYLPPMHYVEVYNAIRDNFLPDPRETVPGADHFDHETLAGVHYHLDYLTPYWDPEGGFRFDMNYATGVPIFGEPRAFNSVDAQFSIVKKLPDGLGYLSDTRVAARLYGATGLPNDGEYFSLGGSSLFRGFDLQQRQGSTVWVGSLEWRAPLARGLEWDCVDHVFGLRDIYAAAFYDVGDAYLNGHSVGGVAHALGAGIRLNVSYFSFIERSIIRFDVAKTVNDNTPVQFWIGVGVPF